MKRKLLCTMLSFSIFSFIAQENAYLEWVRPMGSTLDDKGYSVASDNQGNTYTTGEFQGTGHFNPPTGNGGNIASFGNKDGFFVKHDSNGDFVYALNFGGSGEDYGSKIVTDASGNFYITGRFSGTGVFMSNPNAGFNSINLVANGTKDVFVVKYNTNGLLLWGKNFGGNPTNGDNDLPGDLDVDSQGNVYITGMFKGTIDLDPGPGTVNATSDYYGDTFLVKLDANGNYVWGKAFGADTDYPYALTYDHWDNTLFVAGSFTASGDFDPSSSTTTLTSNGSHDIFISKFDNSGNFIWAKNIGGANDDKCKDILVSQQGQLVATGSFVGTVDFNPNAGTNNLTSNGNADAFFLKLATSTGYYIWAKNVGSSSGEIGESVAVDSNNDLFFAGSFAGTTDFDPGTAVHNLGATGGRNAFVLKLDNSGNYIWAVKAGENQADDIAYEVVLKNDQNVIVTGYFSPGTPSTTDFDPTTGDNSNTASEGGLDIFLWNLYQCTNTSQTILATVCDSYTAPDGQVYSSNGVYTAIIPNAAGCDSIITINLTVSNSSSSNINVSACDIYTAPDGQEYTTSGLYTAIIPNDAGCDSTITINLTVSSSSSSSINVSDCDSYTAPDGQVYTTSGLYTAIIPNAAGCDSIISIDLTIPSLDTTVSIQNNELTANIFGPGITYQWLDCNDNYLPIPNETNQTFLPQANGSYAVQINSIMDNCPDTSSCHTISNIVGIDHLGVDNLVSVYPLPAQDELFIQVLMDHIDNFHIEVISIEGKTIVPLTKIIGTFAQINISDLLAGTYFVKFYLQEEQRIFKFIKA
ncbi:MAG: T9SS type A sorting domain-containing protein [Flavobacteriales bacterium]|nr:T9SS type A sorting domain-containing protein [Flavobacteriales bacterium]